MSLGLRLNFAQTEFARGAASGVCSLHEDGRIWKARFVHINAHLGVAAGVGEDLSVERRRIWARKSKRQASSLNRRARFGDAKMHVKRVIFVH